MKRKIMPERWWDGRSPGSFFRTVYRLGDDSLDGFLEEFELTSEQRTQRECDVVEQYLELKPGGRILDCPSGYGRHSIELAKRGYEVLGIDRCLEFLEEAKIVANKTKGCADIQFLEGDMRALAHDLPLFDACINMFLSFGFFEHEENLQVLREYRRVLRPGGKLLIHTDVNPSRAAAGSYQDRPKRKLKGGGKLLVDEQFDPETGILRGKWTLLKGKNAICSPDYSVRIYTHNQLENLLELAGFHKISIFDMAGNTISDNPMSQEVVYVAR